MFRNKTKVAYLNVFGNSFTELAPDMFAESAEMLSINLKNNNIDTIPDGTFNGLAALRVLQLSSNRITTLQSGLFDGSPLLTSLELNSNGIISLPSAFLSTLVGRNNLKKILMIDNTLDCPVRERALASGLFVDMPNCTCKAPPLGVASDLTYSLVTASNIKCEKEFLPGNAECTKDARGDASCSEGLCREHCCTQNVAETCPVCGNTGDCYRPLAVRAAWEDAVKLNQESGWITRLNQGELQSLKGPPDAFTRTMLNNAKRRPDNVTGTCGGGVSSARNGFKYRLAWSTDEAATEVGKTPSAASLYAEGQGFDPGFIVLDSDTGDIYAVPKNRGSFTAWLIVTDCGGSAEAAGLPTTFDEVVLKRWSFEVTEVLRLGVAAAWTARNTANDTNTNAETTRYQVGKVIEEPGPSIERAALFTNPAGGDAGAVRYVFTVLNRLTGKASDPGDGKFFVSQSGETSIKVLRPGDYTAKLEATDRESSVTVREWNFTALVDDTQTTAYGPNGRGCANGVAVDGEEMDEEFSCDCSATKFTGENCEVETVASSDQDGTTAAVIGAVLAVLVLAVVTAVLIQRWQRHTRSMLATNFLEQLDAMRERGEVDEAQALNRGVPRELKRTWLALIDKLGHGAFGDVWKGLIKDSDNPHVPEYMVACKVVKEASSGSLDAAGFAAAEMELLKEALLMAQVETHTNLVALVGVITRGNPKILVLSFCEHGELQGLLKKRAADGDVIPGATKCRFCKEVADGMAHLAKHNFVHRDLAARNVLLGSGMVCKVADFGLSRRVQTEDNTGDYYRSSSGIIPVRWTAPEGITAQKFSSASDVWSFGITCMEIFQDGAAPYPGVKSNPEVIKLVCTQGSVHQQPIGCADEVYLQLKQCFRFDPNARPEFRALADFFAGMGKEAEGGGAGGATASRPNDADACNLGYRDKSGAYDLGYGLDADAGAGHTDLGPPQNLNYDLGHQDSGASAGTDYDLGCASIMLSKVSRRVDHCAACGRMPRLWISVACRR